MDIIMIWILGMDRDKDRVITVLYRGFRLITTIIINQYVYSSPHVEWFIAYDRSIQTPMIHFQILKIQIHYRNMEITDHRPHNHHLLKSKDKDKVVGWLLIALTPTPI